jgi:KRAB domain-containing zinc finger protein
LSLIQVQTRSVYCLELDNEGNLQICVRPLVVEYRPSDTDIDQTETLKDVEDERTEYSKSFKCDVSEKDFPSRSMLKYHCVIHKSGVNNFTCVICNEAFNNWYDFKVHTNQQTGDKTHTNIDHQQAAHQFGNDSLMTTTEIHTNTSHKKSKLRDNSCSVSLKTRPSTPTNRKPYKCKFCEKTFSHNCRLKTHSRIHTGVKPYKCKFCEKTFNHNCSLKTHSRIHTGVKPYKCKFCEKTFSQSCNLKTHSRIHTDVKPYKCKFCEKTFSQNCNLKNSFQNTYRCQTI